MGFSVGWQKKFQIISDDIKSDINAIWFEPFSTFRFSLNALKDLEYSRPWTGSEVEGGNELVECRGEQ